MTDHFLSATLLAFTLFAARFCPARAQEDPPPARPALRAVLVEGQARRKAAGVSVVVHDFKLVDPDLAQERPVSGEGHLNYQLDDGPVISTTATRLRFLDLQPGEHTISVSLAANNDEPLGPRQTLTIRVP